MNISRFAFCILLLISLKSNAQWSPSVYPIDFTDFNQIDFVGEDTIWGIEFNGIVLSTDKGQSFSRRNSKIIVNGTHIFHNDQNWYYTAGGLYVSKDYGNSWSKIQIKSNLGDTLYKGIVHQAHIFENGQGFALGTGAAGNYRLFHTNNNGENWVEKDSNLVHLKDYLPGNSPLFVGKVYCFDSTCIAWNNLDKNKFWIFSNYGNTVDEVDLNSKISNDIRSFAFSDEMNGLLLTSSKVVYYFNNGLNSLKQVGNCPASVALDFAQKSTKNISFYVVGSPVSEGSYYSIDTGLTWKPMGDLFGHFFIKMKNASIGISSNNSEIRTFNMVLNGIPEKSDFDVFCVYPNPTNNRIYFTGKTDLENINIEIKNLAGELVQHEKNKSEIDLNNLPNGIYILTIESINSYVVKKVVKE
ncbi:MAG: T9SS type A sorting domain-containing protein [Bacteroidia bacterium]|jgi:hypothetical protein|nr:T9SS type A sorting domain-containing protein [Bacteroidia bacterium]